MDESILCPFSDIRLSDPGLPQRLLPMAQNPAIELYSEPFECYLLRPMLFVQLCLIGHYHPIQSQRIIPIYIYLGTLV
jgi:hypothetical protein